MGKFRRLRKNADVIDLDDGDYDPKDDDEPEEIYVLPECNEDEISEVKVLKRKSPSTTRKLSSTMRTKPLPPPKSTPAIINLFPSDSPPLPKKLKRPKFKEVAPVEQSPAVVQQRKDVLETSSSDPYASLLQNLPLLKAAQSSTPAGNFVLPTCTILEGDPPPKDSQRNAIVARFNREVLSWSLLAPFPDHSLLSQHGEFDVDSFSVFSSLAQYIQFFEPLFFEDFHDQLVDVWRDKTEKKKSVAKDIHIRSFETHQESMYGLALEIPGAYPDLINGVFVHLFNAAHPELHALGLVDRADRISTNHGASTTAHLRVYLPKDIPRLKRFGEWLMGVAVEQSKKQHSSFQLVPLDSAITSLREFVALHSVGSLRLFSDLIGRPHPPEPKNGSVWDGLTPGFTAQLAETLNPSQLIAVQEACSKPHSHIGFTLLQGPPGTGKTKTVVSLLNAFHISRFNSYYTYLYQKATQRLKKRASVEVTSNPNLQDLELQNILTMQDELYGGQLIAVSKPRILVCAPSNAGVDEIVDRVMSVGLVDGNLRPYKPDVLRVGGGLAVRQSVKSSISLDVKVEEYFRLTVEQLKQRIEEGQVALRNTEDRLNSLRITDSQPPKKLCVDVVNLCEKRQLILLDVERSKIALDGLSAPDSSGARQDLERSFLNEAQIVFCTLSGAGSREMQKLRRGFDHLVIDEAGQSTELSVLIALCHNVRHCVLVGDPRQLPATTFIQSGNAKLYERSLFERLESAAHEVHALSIQYRMHPEIREFPSTYYYQARLTDGPNVLKPDYSPSFHHHPSKRFGPFCFFDLPSFESRGQGADNRSTSVSNPREATFIVHLLQELLAEAPDVTLDDIGVITFYTAQKNLLEHELAKLKSEQKTIEVSTVDGFQGREKRIIVISCVRAGVSRIGFLADRRRMNVALSRAKHSLWIVGDGKALSSNKDWVALLEHAKLKGNYRDCAPPSVQRLARPPPPPPPARTEPPAWNARPPPPPVRTVPRPAPRPPPPPRTVRPQLGRPPPRPQARQVFHAPRSRPVYLPAHSSYRARQLSAPQFAPTNPFRPMDRQFNNT